MFEVKRGKPYIFQFHCPKCGQRVRPKNGRFECKHQGTEHKKGLLDDPDKYLLDEVVFKILREGEG